MGHWKNFDQLESEISLPELFAILEAERKRQDREHKFFAAIQGIDYGADDSGNASKTGDDVVRAARAKSAGYDPSDVAGLRGKNAEEAGFGVGMGLGYEIV